MPSSRRRHTRSLCDGVEKYWQDNKEKILTHWLLYKKYGDRGFYVTSENIAEIVDLIANGEIHFNDSKLLLEELDKERLRIVKFHYDCIEKLYPNLYKK